MKKVQKNNNSVTLANKDRRNFLKLLAIGGGLLASGKLLDSMFAPAEGVLVGMKEFDNFTIKETTGQISFTDKKSGAEILVIDKEGSE